MQGSTKMNEVETAATAVAASGGVSGGKASVAYGAAKTASLFVGAGSFVAAFVMFMLAPPQSRKEWALLIVSILAGAYWGSYFVIFYFGWDLHNDWDGHNVRSGIAAVCGAASWLVIKGAMTWVQKNPDKTIIDLLRQLLSIWRGGQ